MDTERSHLKPRLIAIGVILVIGIFTALFFVRQVDTEQRSLLLQQTQYAALLVNADQIAQLRGDEADIDNPVYQKLKQLFTQFRAYNPRIRFVYLMGYRPNIEKEFFYFDSEPVTSGDYSPPGQLFEDTNKKDIEGFVKGNAYTSGPYRDAWGEWVSGNAPVKDLNGETVGMVGIDIATSVWHRDSAFVWSTVGTITILLSILVLFLLQRIYRKQDSINVLQDKNRTLTYKEKKLSEIQTLAQLGKITIYFDEETIVVDEQLEHLFHEKKSPMTIADFLLYTHPDDQQTVKTAFEEIKTSDNQYSWFDARVGSRSEGYRLYHFYGTIDRKGSVRGVRFSGIMQDITDIKK